MADISEEFFTELKQAFVMFDKDGDGYIQTSELALVFKYLNQFPTEEELQAMIAEVDPEGNSQLDFATFVLLMQKNMKDDDTQEALLEVEQNLYGYIIKNKSFKVFDPEQTGQISIPDLRYILSILGDKMTNEEVDEIIKEVDPDLNGYMKYEEFVKDRLDKLKK